MSGAIIPGGPRVPVELVTDAGVNVQSDGELVIHKAGTVNFEGGGVSVENVAGVATVTITGGAGGTVETDATLKGTGSSGDLLGINPGHVAVVPDGTTIGGTGATGTPLHTIDGATGVSVDGTTIAGTGKTGAPLHTVAGGTAIVSDGTTIAGNGVTGTPIHTVAGGTAVAVDGTTIGGNGLTGNPLHTIGGGGGGVAVEEAGTPIISGATTLNFTGATVTDAGGGVASVVITGGGALSIIHNDITVVTGASAIDFEGASVTVVADSGDPTIAVVTISSATQKNFIQDCVDADGWNPGQFGYVSTLFDHRFQASANNDTEQDAQTIGAVTAISSGGGGVVHVCVAGPLTLTAAQWHDVNADGTDLVPGIYYLADFNAGSGFITAVKPTTSGSFITVVGFAVSTTTMIIRPEAAILIP